MQVINLVAGPGAGKSTTAAGVFRELKLRGLNAELVTEYAKDMTWEKRHNVLEDQLYVFSKQHRRQLRLRDQVDYVVTDSPLLLSLLYMPDHYPQSFETFVLDMWHSFNNEVFFVDRKKAYNPIGRNQTEDEAIAIDRKVEKLLNHHGIPYAIIPGIDTAPREILRYLGIA